jgi:hypothetical protein
VRGEIENVVPAIVIDGELESPSESKKYQKKGERD